MGPFALTPLMEDMFPKLVRHVLPEPIVRPPSEIQQLILTPDEMRFFCRHVPNLRQLFLDRNAPCPTLLHSMGSQATACPCGCRDGPFSEATLQSRGIYGIVVPTGEEVSVDGQVLPELRHPHPLEVAALSGIPLPLDLPGPLRLWLCGIGQQASPVHSLWVGSQVQFYLDRAFLGTTKVSASKNLTAFRNKMLVWCRQLKPAPASSIALPDSGPVDFDLPLAVPVVCSSPWTGFCHQGDALSCTLVDESGISLLVRLSDSSAVLFQILAASVSLGLSGAVHAVDCSTGLPLSIHDLVCSRCIWIETHDVDMADPHAEHAATHLDVAPEEPEVSPTVPFAVETPVAPVPMDVSMVSGVVAPAGPPDPWSDVLRAQQVPCDAFSFDPLLPLGALQLLSLKPPVVPSCRAWLALTSQEMKSSDRLKVLKNQGLTWADDEFNWHVSRLLGETRRNTWEFIDPVVVRSFLDHPGRILEDWFVALPAKPTVLLGAVPVAGHWTPFVWTWNSSHLFVHSWDVADSPGLKLDHLHEAIRRLVGSIAVVVNFVIRDFAQNDACGNCAFRFLDHWIRGKPLPTEAAEACWVDGLARRLFQAELAARTTTPRPWIWAAGLEPRAHNRLEDLLRQHGVPPDQVSQRIQLACQAMGFPAVQKAVTGAGPLESFEATC